MIEAYAWLTTCLLGGIVFTAIIELVGFATPGFTPLLTLTALYFVGLMCLMSFRRFWLMLSRAQTYANRANCPRCGSYGAFAVTIESARIPVRCGKCGQQWTIR